MKVSYGFMSLQHLGYVTEYLNGVLYHIYYNQWINKA